MHSAHTAGRRGAVPTWDGFAGLIRRHPLTAFLVWFFTVGQALAFAPRQLDTGIADQWFIVASTLVGLLLPTVAITRIVDGQEGLRRLRRQVTSRTAAPHLYLIGLLVMPLLTVGIAVALVGAPQVPASTVVTTLGGALLVNTVVGFALNNLWEEVAWTGFVQARLQERHGPMRAAAITAPLFALQHTALAVGNGVSGAVILLLALAVVSIPFRAFNGWVYNRTGGGLFLVGLIHALSNAVGPGAGFSAGYLRQLYPADAETVGVLHILALAIMGLVVIAVTRGRLGAAPRRPSRDPASAPAEVR